MRKALFEPVVGDFPFEEGYRGLFPISPQVHLTVSDLLPRLARVKRRQRYGTMVMGGTSRRAIMRLALLAEEIAADCLHRRLQVFTRADALTSYSGPDIVFHGIGFDVKGSRPETSDLMVRADQFARAAAEGIHAYWFIKPVSRKLAHHFIFSAYSVSFWPVVDQRWNRTFPPARMLRLDSIQPGLYVKKHFTQTKEMA